MSMKISVSLAESDAQFLDLYSRQHGVASRSEVIRLGLQLLREKQLEAAYMEAFAEWEGSEDQRLWDVTTADGIQDEAW